LSHLFFNCGRQPGKKSDRVVPPQGDEYFSIFYIPLMQGRTTGLPGEERTGHPRQLENGRFLLCPSAFRSFSSWPVGANDSRFALRGMNNVIYFQSLRKLAFTMNQRRRSLLGPKA